MRTLFLLICALLFSASLTSAQGTKAPKFDQYPALVERAKARSIDFKRSPDARSFRTRLTNALERGVNFAGHYIIAGWGCGTGCISGAVIDARNGRVFFPEQFNAMATGSTADGGYVDNPVEYHKNSRLMVLRGIPGTKSDNDPQKPEGVYYYEWKNDRFRLIRSIKAAK